MNSRKRVLVEPGQGDADLGVGPSRGIEQDMGSSQAIVRVKRELSDQARERVTRLTLELHQLRADKPEHALRLRCIHRELENIEHRSTGGLEHRSTALGMGMDQDKKMIVLPPPRPSYSTSTSAPSQPGRHGFAQQPSGSGHSARNVPSKVEKVLATSATRPSSQSLVKALAAVKNGRMGSKGRGRHMFPDHHKYISFDVCDRCQVQKYVDRERALVVCPLCATTMPYLTHVTTVKGVEVDDGNANQKMESMAHIGKSLAQYRMGNQSKPSVHVLESVVNQYRTQHSLGLRAAARASTIMKHVAGLGCRGQADIIDRMIRGIGIPVFTDAQAQQILHKRQLLYKLEQDALKEQTNGSNNNHQNESGDGPSEEKDSAPKPATSGKSQQNVSYFAAISLAFNNPMAYLYPPDKTPQIHIRRMKQFDKLIRELQEITQSNIQMFPCT